MKNKSHSFAVILCGGHGKRVWPMSTLKNPKYAVRIHQDETILDFTIKRLLGIFRNNNIFLITNVNTKDLVFNISRKYNIPYRNIITESITRNTLAAFSLATSIIQSKHGDCNLFFFPADHYFENNKEFIKIINQLEVHVNHNRYATIGIKPNFPSTDYGYLIPKESSKGNFFTIRKFIEKPRASIAQKLIKSHVFWNAGIYAFKSNFFEHLVKTYQPLYHILFENIKNHEDIYKTLPQLSIDKGISELLPEIYLVPYKQNWLDLGDWNQLKIFYEVFFKRKMKNLMISVDGKEIISESNNSLVIVSNHDRVFVKDFNYIIV